MGFFLSATWEQGKHTAKPAGEHTDAPENWHQTPPKPFQEEFKNQSTVSAAAAAAGNYHIIKAKVFLQGKAKACLHEGKMSEDTNKCHLQEVL